MTQAVSPQRRPHAPGTPCWASLLVRDLPGSRGFYGGLFGWEFVSGPQKPGPYVSAMLAGREVAALGRAPAERKFPIAWIPYLASDDADATAELIRMCGGTVAVGPLDAGTAGRLVVAADPSGAPFGVRQGGGETGGEPAEAGGHGTPAWFELVTHTTAGPGSFYPAVFGYDAQAPDADGGDGLSLVPHPAPGADAGPANGWPVTTVRGTREERALAHGPHWKTCFAVPDVHEAVRRTVELGGRLVREPHPTPYGLRADVTDPQDARFSVLQRDTAALRGARGR